MIRKRYSTPYLFYAIWIELFEENPKESHFHQPRLVLALLLSNDVAENFPRFLLLCFLSIRSCFFNVTAAIVKVSRSPGSRGPQSDLVLVPWSRVGWGRFPVSVKRFYSCLDRKVCQQFHRPRNALLCLVWSQLLIAATVTTGLLQDGLLQDLYFERKMAEFSELWEINNGNGTKYNEIRKNTSHMVLIHLASKERNSIPSFSLISGFYSLNLVVVSVFLLSIFRFMTGRIMHAL